MCHTHTRHTSSYKDVNVHYSASRHSSVGKVIRLPVDQPMNRGSIRNRATVLFVSNLPYFGQSTLLLNGHKIIFSWEQSGRGVKLTNHLHRADVTNWWSYTCTPPHIFNACKRVFYPLPYLFSLSFFHSFFLSVFLSFSFPFFFLSFCHSFFLSLIHSFIHSFFLSLCPSFILSFFHSFFLSFFLSFLMSFIHSFFLSFFHSFTLSFFHSFFLSFFPYVIHSLFFLFFFLSFLLSFIHYFFLSFFLSLLQLRNIGLEENKPGSVNDKSETGGMGAKFA